MHKAPINMLKDDISDRFCLQIYAISYIITYEVYLVYIPDDNVKYILIIEKQYSISFNNFYMSM